MVKDNSFLQHFSGDYLLVPCVHIDICMRAKWSVLVFGFCRMKPNILVPRAYDPSGLWLGSRALAGPDFLSMRRVFVSHCQPIRFAGFDGKSVNHGLPVLDQTRALDPNH